MRKLLIVICSAILVMFCVATAYTLPPYPIWHLWDNVTKFVTVEKSADTVTLTAGECSGTLITNRGWDGVHDQTFTLPEADTTAADGLKFKLLAVVASAATADTYLDTEGSTTNIYLNGTAVGNGERVWTEEIAIGESIECYAATIDGTTYDWFCDKTIGTWADKGS